MVDEAALQAQLAAIRTAFIAELPQREQRIRDAWQHWQQGAGEEGAATFHREVHSLAGAGATFGCDELSKRARALEQRCKARLKVADPSSDNELVALYDQLEDEIHQVSGAA